MTVSTAPPLPGMPRARPRGGYLPASAVERAQLLIGAVHEEGPEAVAEVLLPLTVGQLYAVAVTLAAMCPSNYTPAELLVWNDEPTIVAPPVFPEACDGLAPHGTHSAFNRHTKRGEEPCDWCVEGERLYQRDRARRRRAEVRDQQMAVA